MEKRFIVTRDKELQSEQNAEEYPNLRRRLRQLSVDLWIWEVGSLLLSTACVGATIVILLKYDNKPLPTWNYGLTINGVISVLAVVAKASMILPIAEAISQLKWHWYWGRCRPIMDFQVFDAASRGPWGCIQMLCRPKQISLATIGAFLTLATLFMEPSLQLIPTFVPKLVESGQATVPRSFYYEDRDTAPQSDVFSDTGFSSKWSLGARTKYGLYTSMFGLPGSEKQPAAFVCPTGNCTFPVFSSIGVCSECTNVSSSLTRDFKPTDNDWVLPSGASTNKGVLSQSLSDPSMVYQPVVNQTIANFFYLDDYMLPNGSWAKPQAFECILWMCVKTFSASMSEGVFREEVLSRWPEANESIPDFPDLPVAQAEPSGNYTFRPPDHTAEYTVDMFTVAMLKNWLTMVFFGFGWFTGQTVASSSVNLAGDLGQAFYRAQQITKSPLSNSVNVTSELYGPGKILDRVTDGMTVAIRNMAGSRSSVLGSAKGVQTFVEARWIWVVLPVSLVVLTFAFMVVTLVTSLLNGIPVWKSSSLAVLVHDLGDDTRDRVQAAKLGAMETNADDHTMAVVLKQSR